MSPWPATPDPWTALGRHTAARIALGRAGGSLPTNEVLKFSFEHAQARDAVHSDLDMKRLRADMASLGLPVVEVKSRVTDRLVYLQRPDLGCELDEQSRVELDRQSSVHGEGFDLVLIVADGLSATAAQCHAAAVLADVVPQFQRDRVRPAPLVLARFARVGLQDPIGELLHARASLILLGERPGLRTAQSLGAYLVFNPRPGNTNAQRNCVSNIWPGGLKPADAAATLHYLVMESLQRKISGVGLKDERGRKLSEVQAGLMKE